MSAHHPIPNATEATLDAWLSTLVDRRGETPALSVLRWQAAPPAHPAGHWQTLLRCSHARLARRIERAAARLYIAWGVRPGDPVRWQGPTHGDMLTLLFAVARLGARLCLPRGDDAVLCVPRVWLAGTEPTSSTHPGLAHDLDELCADHLDGHPPEGLARPDAPLLEWDGAVLTPRQLLHGLAPPRHAHEAPARGARVLAAWPWLAAPNDARALLELLGSGTPFTLIDGPWPREPHAWVDAGIASIWLHAAQAEAMAPPSLAGPARLELLDRLPAEQARQNWLGAGFSVQALAWPDVPPATPDPTPAGPTTPSR